MKKFNFNSKKLKYIIVPIILIILLVSFILLLSHNKREKENSLFSVEKIIIFNNANVEDNADDPSLRDMAVSQYSDLSIYINNNSENSELTNSNTIKEMYIDNISITSNNYNDGTSKIFNYINPLTFGKYHDDLEQAENNRITFNILNTNEQSENTDYNTPTFYTDCSNPITLGYINKHILKNY